MLAYGAAAGATTLLVPSSAWAAQAAQAAAAPVAGRLRAFAEAVLAANGFPGVSIAFVGPGGVSSAFAAGLADLDRGTAAAPGQLFQIGSITKSLTAMAIFALVGRGRLDLAATVQGLLPEVPLPPEPITVTHLLEHSSGLPNSLEQTPFLDVPGGRLWSGFAPGSRYSYCNLGYTLLGMIIERASGMPFPQALRSLVLQPIGMAGARPVIRLGDRGAYATGHVRFREDIPWLPRARLTAARWLDVHTAAGSVAASAGDMIHYLRRIVELGRGRGAPLFSDALAERFRTPTIDSSNGPGARYGNGLATLAVAGHRCLRHTGGMIGFSSAITVDPEAGVGCYASVNVGGAGGYRPVEITEYGLLLLRAAAAGGALPAAPEPQRGPAVEPARILGRWVGPGGRELIVAEAAGGLRVASGGIERPLAAATENAFVTDHPLLEPYALVLEAGEVPLLRLGDQAFGRGEAPAARVASPRLAALAGTYYSPGAWSSRLIVHAFGDRLLVDGNVVTEAADGSWRFSEPARLGERIWFEDVAGGRPQNLNLSGTRFSRLPEIAAAQTRRSRRESPPSA
jgi:CubicO group peptidase (beta-lactamase class C family)